MRQRGRLWVPAQIALVALFTAVALRPPPASASRPPLSPIPYPLPPLLQAACLAPAEALAHAGEQGCVEGVVTNATYAPRSNGQPTFLDFGPAFTAVIWGDDRPKFNPAPETLRGQRLRVSGRITTFREKAQIVVRDPAQLGPAGSAPPPAPAPRQAPSPAPPAATPAPTPDPTTATPPPAPPTVTVIPAGTPATSAAPPASVGTAPRTPAAEPAALALTPIPAVAAPALVESPTDDGNTARLTLVTGVALIALGLAGAAWYTIRRR